MFAISYCVVLLSGMYCFIELEYFHLKIIQNNSQATKSNIFYQPISRKETGRDFAWDRPVVTWASCMIASFAGSLIANPLLGTRN